MTPDQVAQVQRSGLEAENLRQESVRSILRQPNLAAAAELNRAQANRIRNPIQKTAEEVELIKAQTASLIGAGKLSTARARELDKLSDAKLLAARMNNTVLGQEIDSKIKVILEGTEGPEEVLASSSDVINALSRAAGARTPSDLPERKFQETQVQTAVEIEQAIRNNPKSDESLSRYQDLNRFSNKSKVAVNPTGKKVEWIPLSKVGGRNWTAAQVDAVVKKLGFTVDQIYTNAEAAQMDFMEYLQVVIQNVTRGQ